MTPAETFLAHLQIASPCDAAWADMRGDDRKRLCAQCDKHVYDVAHLTTAEVMALFEGQGPLPCLRLWRRADGTVLTADCPVGARKVRSRRRTRYAAAFILGLLAGAPAILGAQAPMGGAPAPMPHLMGKVACPTPDPKPGPTRGGKPRRGPKPTPQRPIMGLIAQPPSVTMGEVVAPLPKTGTPKR
ncbi:MAG TPA: hypothetical protein VJ570_01140 [Holophagaceae bacterium]|nr:hypothetical protein [Holophagaceae bacterium]